MSKQMESNCLGCFQHQSSYIKKNTCFIRLACSQPKFSKVFVPRKALEETENTIFFSPLLFFVQQTLQGFSLQQILSLVHREQKLYHPSSLYTYLEVGPKVNIKTQFQWAMGSSELITSFKLLLIIFYSTIKIQICSRIYLITQGQGYLKLHLTPSLLNIHRETKSNNHCYFIDNIT